MVSYYVVRNPLLERKKEEMSKGNIYEYNMQFESNGLKYRVQQSGLNIHDVINRIRKKYPEAKHFIILKKMAYPHPIG